MRKMFLLFSFKNNFFLILHVNTSNKKRYLCKKKIGYCGPRIFDCSMRFPLDGELDFYLIWKMIFIHGLKNDLESPLIFVLFLKG